MFDLVVMLWRAGERPIGEFEHKVIPVVRAHGGQLLSAFRPQADAAGGCPDEVHVLRFPSREHFAAYRADPIHEALRPMREQVIARSEILLADESIDYSGGEDSQR